jgi:hypothetical protein
MKASMADCGYLARPVWQLPQKYTDLEGVSAENIRSSRFGTDPLFAATLNDACN